MLVLEAEIRFDTPDLNELALPNELDTSHIIRPSINFGNDILLSGDITAEKEIKFIVRGELYMVKVSMPTVEEEAYEAIKNFVKVDSTFKIQNASRVVGCGRIVSYKYE